MAWISGTEIDGPLSLFVKRYPRCSLEEYEGFLVEAIGLTTRQPGRTLVLQGPSPFNAAETDPACVPESEALFRSVNELARRLADAHGLTFIDRMSLANSHAMFLPGSIRLSTEGHRITGHAVAETLVRAGLI